MGKSRSKSNSRSISRWLLAPFKSGERAERTEKSTEEPSTGGPKSSSNNSQNEQRPRKNRKKDVEASKTSEDSISSSVPTSPNPPVNAPVASTAPGSVQNTEKKEKEKEKEKEKDKEKEKEKQPKSEEAPSKAKKKDQKKKEEKKEEEEGSIFEEVDGVSAPVQTGTRGVKNKMRWKIDVDPVDVNGDQKMSEVLEKLSKLRKKAKAKEDEPGEDLIITSARVLQLIKLEALISKELTEAEQDTLKAFCRSGDHEEKAETIVEKVAVAALNGVVSKNEFARQLTIPGQLRMFAVDEKKAKLPMMALLMARKDLLYVSWSKPNREVEKEVDSTWTNMATKKVTEVKSVRL